PGETAAAGRGTEASVKLLEGQESLAEALGTTASEVSINDVVYSSTTASAIDTEDAATTFFEEDSGPASAAAVAIACAILIAALCATGCVGVVCGKCWLNQQRAKVIKEEERRLKLQPAYEYHQPGGGGGGGGAGAAGGTASSTSDGAALKSGGANGNNNSNAFGRLAPAVSVGGNPLDGAHSQAAGGGGGGYSFDLENGPDGGEDLVEHKYGETGPGFVDGVEGAYSDFDGNQSAYSDSVVPGGDTNDGAMSERSSAKFYEDDGTSDWGGTDLTGAAMGGSILGPEFPLRKGMVGGGGPSSRFSAGPRSQASFAANSVAASGRSVPSSVNTGGASSRSNFPPRGGMSPPYSLGGAGGGGASPLR
ncbi:unnamed protein product, partial [Ectocarpus sp. 12 AP-2014]